MRIPVLMAILLSLLSIAADIYILGEIRGGFRNVSRRNDSGSSEYYARKKSKRKWSIIYGVSAVLCWMLLALILLLPKRAEGESILPTMWMLYSYITIYVGKFIYVIFSLLGRLFSSPVHNNKILKHRVRVCGNVFGVLLGVTAFGAFWYGAIVTRNDIEVVDVSIDYASLPKAFDGYRIVQISDMHLGTWGGNTNFVSRLVREVNNLHPDIILFTGDIVNRKTDEMKPFLETLAKLKAPDGIYSILGNHDYGDYIDWDSTEARRANNELMAEWQSKIGWKLLNNEHTFIKKGNQEIVLIGVENWGEPPFKQYGKLTKAYPASKKSKYNLHDNRFKILMSHNPKHWHEEVRKKSNIDLTLSGHTHAMQTMLKIGGFRWSPSALKYEEWAGLYEDEVGGRPVKLYVNVGCGEVGMPFRIGATPEITLITLRKK